ncbi:MAG: HEPN domain-containing protein [Egibacteraceae bacterium]
MSVATFDANEYERWVQTARDHLDVARHDAAGGFSSAAVLQSEQAAQCALKALLHGAGQAQAARGHGLLSLADACGHWAGLVVDEEERRILGRLARDYLTTRYPDALPEGTPMAHYGEEDAERAVIVASRVLERVASAWDSLLRAADDDETVAPPDGEVP